ncbi:MAG: hypothetical protein FJZ96_10220 [Chloroflexi bacterium]|nr:hypothetical protein [Chloroflexota bacterium]
MTKETTPDLQQAHEYFSKTCFNRAWDFLDMASRTAEEDRQMLQLGLASLWHWSQRSDCTPTHTAIGAWQVSRIYAVLGKPDEARQYGESSLQASQSDGVPPFYMGYAYEALARAEAVAGEQSKMMEYLSLARQASEKVADPQERKALLDDLATIR